VDKEFWQGKKVLLTGHTGFKGAWLSLWLRLLGARIIGYSLAPPTTPSLFEVARLRDLLTHIERDIRDLAHLQEVVQTHSPEIVIHLAAQALVRRSYQEPVETYATNILGTVHLLEAVRRVGGVRAIIIVTSDKCYDNREWVWAYREIDPLGGLDPYASSKGCAELITAAYRHSFFQGRPGQPEVALASVRAGNVIGGGDWAEDRLIPDIIKAFAQATPVIIRYPHAQRPWQHVLEALGGYLLLAEKLYGQGAEYAGAWNFGPAAGDARPVAQVVDLMANLWGSGAAWELAQEPQPPETQFLRLDSSKARSQLGWKPKLNLDQALALTVAWYQQFQKDPATIREFTESQITFYANLT
jgi:CDP-glucose 4,6-dehydratase